jgi:hypothetical protein
MKYLFFLLLSSIVIFGGCSYPYLDDSPYYEEEEAFFDKIRKTGRHFASKYNITFAGQTATSPGGILERAGLIFTTREPFSKEMLRRFLVECSIELLAQMNSNANVQPFVEQFPLTIRNIKILIYNKDKDNRDVFTPEMSSASITNGILLYRYWTQGFLSVDKELEEAFEEALEKIYDN